MTEEKKKKPYICLSCHKEQDFLGFCGDSCRQSWVNTFEAQDISNNDGWKRMVEYLDSDMSDASFKRILCR